MFSTFNHIGHYDAAQLTRGLYDPASEHDSCGFGLIAQVDGTCSRSIIDGALLQALSNMGMSGWLALVKRWGWLRGCY